MLYILHLTLDADTTSCFDQTSNLICFCFLFAFVDDAKSKDEKVLSTVRPYEISQVVNANCSSSPQSSATNSFLSTRSPSFTPPTSPIPLNVPTHNPSSHSLPHLLERSPLGAQVSNLSVPPPHISNELLTTDVSSVKPKSLPTTNISSSPAALPLENRTAQILPPSSLSSAHTASPSSRCSMNGLPVPSITSPQQYETWQEVGSLPLLNVDSQLETPPQAREEILAPNEREITAAPIPTFTPPSSEEPSTSYILEAVKASLGISSPPNVNLHAEASSSPRFVNLDQQNLPNMDCTSSNSPCATLQRRIDILENAYSQLKNSHHQLILDFKDLKRSVIKVIFTYSV